MIKHNKPNAYYPQTQPTQPVNIVTITLVRLHAKQPNIETQFPPKTYNSLPQVSAITLQHIQAKPHIRETAEAPNPHLRHLLLQLPALKHDYPTNAINIHASIIIYTNNLFITIISHTSTTTKQRKSGIPAPSQYGTQHLTSKQSRQPKVISNTTLVKHPNVTCYKIHNTPTCRIHYFVGTLKAIKHPTVPANSRKAASYTQTNQITNPNATRAQTCYLSFTSHHKYATNNNCKLRTNTAKPEKTLTVPRQCYRTNKQSNTTSNL
eukprot:gene2960-1942_t